MRRKDMKPGVLYAIAHCGNYRPGLVLDAAHERIRARVYWTWPGTLWPYDEPIDPIRLEVDYLNLHPDIIDPRAKFDDKVVKTGDVLQEWTSWATEERARRDQRLADRVAKDAQEAADKAAAIADNTARVEAMRPLLQGHTGYLTIDQLLYAAKVGWTQDRYSARDIVDLLEQVAVAARRVTL